MTNDRPSEHGIASTSRRSLAKSPWPFLIAVVVVLIAGWLFRDDLTRWFGGGANSPEEERIAEREESGTVESASPGDLRRSAAGEAWEQTLGRAPSWPPLTGEAATCEEIERDFESACRALDSTDSVRQVDDGEDACRVIEQAVRDLTQNLPVASGEIADTESLAGNVVHFARALGVRRTLHLKRILDRNEKTIELNALVFYRYFANRTRCSDDRTISNEMLYEYSVFLLNTVGGQAYLSRRMPRVTSLAVFYALVEIDAAERAGANRHGFDARPHIVRGRALISTQDFELRDDYLAVLDKM